MSTTRPLVALFLLLSAATSACSSADSDTTEQAEAASTSEGGANTPDANGDAGIEAASNADAAPDAAEAPDAAADVFVDSRDGKSYRTVKIGSQAWFARNLDHEIAGESFCYEGSPQRCAEHGRLYLWSAAPTACPPGAHLGSDAEWKALETALGMATDQLDVEGYSAVRGVNEGATLKAPTGFAATMAGFRSGTAYDALGDRTYFWTASTRNGDVWRRRVAGATPTIFRFTNPPGSFAISVRCVVD